MPAEATVLLACSVGHVTADLHAAAWSWIYSVWGEGEWSLTLLSLVRG